MSEHPRSSDDVLLKKLQKVFGHTQLRPFQQEAIGSVLNGRDGLVVVPTGGGKSLCYQLPALILPGVTVVVSPLIALMEDQVRALKNKGVAAETLHSKMTKDDRTKIYGLLREQKLKLIYVTPERFGVAEFWDSLGAQTVGLLAVDEAHCISQWGHDFRPDYQRLAEAKMRMGNPICLALTATATETTQKDIVESLRLKNPFLHTASVRRENLQFEVHSVVGLEEKVRAVFGLLHFLRVHALNQKQRGSYIIYFSLVETLEKFAREFSKLGVGFMTYHGQMRGQDRSRSLKHFIKGDDVLMLATPAFGLGVDKPNVRAVFHAEVPGSVEAYYQEAGRAGRDGDSSRCVLLFDEDDISIAADFMKWSHPEPEFMRQVYRQLELHTFRSADELRKKLLFYHSRDFRLETTLNLLSDRGVIGDSQDPSQWVIRGDFPEDLNDEGVRAQRLKSAQMKLLGMVQYAQSKDCRMVVLQRYFGEETDVRCGHCDNCLSASTLQEEPSGGTKVQG